MLIWFMVGCYMTVHYFIALQLSRCFRVPFVCTGSVLTICDSTYRKVPVVGRLDFELWRCKVKISQNIVPKSILRFHILWNLQYLIYKLLEGFGAKTVFLCQT